MKQKGRTRLNNRKLVFGIGINDSDYVVRHREFIPSTNKRVIVWRCPFFTTWESMLRRCYSEKNKKRSPTYIGCTVCEEWLRFSNFKMWMEQQEWEGKELDKDLLVVGNKIYCPEFCIFVDNYVNSFVKVEEFRKSKCLPGVYIHTICGRFCARISIGGNLRHIGLFDTEEDAHLAWKREKRLQVLEMADKIPAIVTDALLKRYS